MIKNNIKDLGIQIETCEFHKLQLNEIIYTLL